MLIGWRRGANKLPLTYDEDGARGTWLEKRLALIRELSLQHDIIYLSEPTKNSRRVGFRKQLAKVDYLIIEFAGMNEQFYGDQWQETATIAKLHEGQILFITDDPDLTFPWHLLPDENWSRWTVAVNAINLQACRSVLKMPSAAKIIDLPYASLLPQKPYSTGTIKQAIYYGRPNGRVKQVKQFIPHPTIAVAGKPTEWVLLQIEPIPAPEQTIRSQWYSQWAACLTLYDNKHAETGWRTGRAYHALKAGIPVLTPPGNKGLEWAKQITDPNEITEILDSDLELLFNKQVIQANPTFPKFL